MTIRKFLSIFFVTPVAFIISNFFTLILAMRTYEEAYILKSEMFMFVFFLFAFFLAAIAFVMNITGFFTPYCQPLGSGLQNLFFVIIITVNIMEFVVFGVPFLKMLGLPVKAVSYARFGFPLFHHIAVSSWMFVFFKSKSKVINFLYKLIAFLIPLFIINRDLLLLTVFCFFIMLVMNKDYKKILFLFIITLIVFTWLGGIRSGNALKQTVLPIKQNIYEYINGVGLWIFSYLTVSWFNFSNNLTSKADYLFAENINTFPEVYRFYVYLDVLGFVLFFVIVFCLLVLVCKLFNKKRGLSLIYVFMLYQALTTMFGYKIFISHSVFTVVFIFAIVFIFDYRYVVFNKYRG